MKKFNNKKLYFLGGPVQNISQTLGLNGNVASSVGGVTDIAEGIFTGNPMAIASGAVSAVSGITGMVGNNKKEYNQALKDNQAKFGSVSAFANGGELKSWNPTLGKKDIDFLNWYNNNTLEGKNKIAFDDKQSVYDFYSYYKNTPKAELSNPDAHFPDTYKYPNHPTFSNESIYSTPENPGGKWNKDKYNPKGKFIYSNGGLVEYNNGGSHEESFKYKTKDGRILIFTNKYM